MVGRVVALFVVACAAGAGAHFVTAHTGDTVVAARIPAIPVADTEGTQCPIPAPFRAAFATAAQETDLPLGLLTAVARIESEFEPHARSAAGARGLLQVMPTTASSLRLRAERPDEHVLAGARYLRALLDRFGSSDLALAAYNAGPTAVAAAGGAPTGETLTYVADVTLVWRSLAGCT